jgi:proline iminopeptidase
MTFARKLAGSAGMAAVVYGAWVRPRLMRWGASDEEVSGPYPGAEIFPHGKRGPTMAVTINAPPDRVWPWLVQLGGDRGGWYSWDHLDNAGRPSAREIHPDWQDLALATPSNTGHAAAGQWTRGQLQRLNPTDSCGCTA